LYRADCSSQRPIFENGTAFIFAAAIFGLGVEIAADLSFQTAAKADATTAV